MNTNQIARIASLVGEPARTAMLVELMGGRLALQSTVGAGSRFSFVLPQPTSKGG